MSRNGSGTYSLPSGNPVVTGTVISSTWANTTLNDIASALTTSIASDGQTPITANLPMSGYKLTGLGTGANPGDSVRYEQVFPSLSTETITASGTALTIGSSVGSVLLLNGTTVSLGGSLNINSGNLFLDKANKRVGIGTTAPAVLLHAASTTLNSELARFDDGSVAVSIGTVSSDGYVGTGTNDPMRINANGALVASFYNGTMTLPINGAIEVSSGALFSQSVYNSTTATSADVTVSGVAGALRRSTSSRRWKTDIETVTPDRSNFLYKMRPVWYRSTCEMDRKDWSYYGFIAEEVADLEPRIVHWEDDPDNEGKKRPSGLMYDRLTVFLVMEIQKLRAELDALKAK